MPILTAMNMHTHGHRLRWRGTGWSLVAWVLLVVVVGVSSVAAARWRATQRSSQRSAVQATAAAVAASLATTLRRETDLSTVQQTLLTLNPSLDNVEFSRWFDTLGAKARYPGGDGFGFVESVDAADLSAFTTQLASDPVAGLTVKGAYQVYPPGPRSRYCLLRLAVYWGPAGALPPTYDYCAPIVPGFGVSPTAATLASARDTGKFTTGPTIASDPGLLFAFAPVYSGGVVPSTVQGRRAALRGWVAATFDGTAITSAALGNHHGLQAQIIGAVAGKQLVLTSSGTVGRGRPVVVSVPVEGEGTWSVRVSGTPAVAGLSPTEQAWVIVAVALLVGLLLVGVVQVALRSRGRALRLVEEKTVELRHQALHDALTDLPNRALIMDRLEQLLHRVRRQASPAAVLFIDLDHFKDVNDTYGHAVGDALLRSVAGRLAGAFRESDTVGRLGGDEFVVLVEGESLSAGPAVVAERLLDVLDEPFLLEALPGTPLTVRASIGIAVAGPGTPDEVLRDADIALYEAKAAGKGRFALFHHEPGDAAGQVLLADDVSRAVDNGQLRLVYQPIFDLTTLSLTMVEALLRWQHPTRGLLEPHEFLSVAEDTGALISIGRWVLTEACRQTAAWQRDGYQVGASVNLSASELAHAGVVDHVREALDASGLDARWLSLEVSEPSLMHDCELAAQRLAALKQLGVRLVIDNFGTGYSSLPYLTRFPVDSLKIDRAFVADVARSADSAALIRTFVQLARSLGIATVAVGVEDGDQLRQLRMEDCDGGQGFLFAAPLRPQVLGELLRADLERSAARPGAQDAGSSSASIR